MKAKIAADSEGNRKQLKARNGRKLQQKAAEDIKVAVNDFKGSETIQRWYSDGAPELHAVCRELGIRHDISDPHRSETNGAIERTNGTVIEGARCLLFQSGLPYKC